MNKLLISAMEQYVDIDGDGWIGFDLDGSLAHYDGWKGIEHIGEPIEAAVAILNGFLEEGKDVRIFTARVASEDPEIKQKAINYIKAWCLKIIGRELEVTNEKDPKMLCVYDDRAKQFVQNTGEVVGE